MWVKLPSPKAGVNKIAPLDCGTIGITDYVLEYYYIVLPNGKDATQHHIHFKHICWSIFSNFFYILSGQKLF